MGGAGHVPDARPDNRRTVVVLFIVKIHAYFILAFFWPARIIGGQCPNSLVVKHVLGKDESQVRFLLRAPLKNPLEFHYFLLLLGKLCYSSGYGKECL